MDKMAKNNSKQSQLTSGFTIIELLIVIVIIAILTAITVVVYNGVQDSAAEAVLKSDLRVVPVGFLGNIIPSVTLKL